MSSDRLHQRTAPYFLRDDQTFVWGPDLKQDLARINNHFQSVPTAEREQGIMTFARSPPKLDGSLVRDLRARFLRAGYDDQLPTERAPEDESRDKQLMADIKDWEDAPEMPLQPGEDERETDMMLLKRQVAKRRGSWWQLPKDLKQVD